MRRCKYGSFVRVVPLLLATACGTASPEGVSGTSEAGPGEEASGPEGRDLSCEPRNPVPSEGRLLTRLQYRSTISDLFDGLKVKTDAFPPENEVLGFRTNAAYHRTSPLLAEAHMLAAEEAAGAAVAQITEKSNCVVGLDEACGLETLRELAPRVFRRPLKKSEAAPFEDLFREQFPRQGFARAMALVIGALLQSPQFLYRFEFDGAALSDASGFELSGYEAASRLSYFLWNSMPDTELFGAAAEGKLKTRRQVEAQARRMLKDPKARKTIEDFHAQWLGLDRLSAIARQAPGVSERELGGSYRASILAYFDYIFAEQGAGFDALMGSETVFLDQKLAPLFGVEAPGDGGVFATQWADGSRSGLLTQPALLSLLAHSDQSSPIARGVFVREEILCQPPPPPPPSVDQTVPDPDPNLTTRERFQVHTAEPACAACHALIDPIGFGFEQYDHLGRFREEENGLVLDDSGSVVGVREKAIRGPFNGAVELARILSKSEQVKACLATQWYRYASGRVEQEIDLCSIAQAREMFRDGDMKELLVGIAASDAFRFRTEVEPKSEESGQ